MNQTSLEKIQAATQFLKFFRRCLPATIQAQIRPYLDQPYQLALNVLDCCDGLNYHTAEDIAQKLNISKSSVRQVLSALRNGEMIYTMSAAKGWLLVEIDSSENPTSLAELHHSKLSIQSMPINGNLGKQISSIRSEAFPFNSD